MAPVLVGDAAASGVAVQLTSGKDAVLDIDAATMMANPDGSPVASFEIVEGLADAMVGNLSVDGSTITYTPKPGFIGTASFAFKGCNPPCSPVVTVRIIVGEWPAAMVAPQQGFGVWPPAQCL